MAAALLGVVRIVLLREELGVGDANELAPLELAFELAVVVQKLGAVGGPEHYGDSFSFLAEGPPLFEKLGDYLVNAFVAGVAERLCAHFQVDYGRLHIQEPFRLAFNVNRREGL